MSSRQLPGAVGASLEPAVLLFTLALALATGIVFGLVPAVAVIRGTAASFLKEDSRSGSAGRTTGWLRAALVVAEVALAMMLLVGAGLLIKSFARLQNVKPGFAVDNVLTAQIALPPVRYAEAPARAAFWTRLVEKAGTLPGVTAAGLVSSVPFSGNVNSGSYSIVGYTPGPTEAAPHGRQDVVGGDYFRAMQIPLLEGRVFNDGDTAESTPVAVVDQYLAKKYFAGSSAVGHQVRRGGVPITIVGVVGTVNSIDLSQPVTKERLYYPVTQRPQAMMALMLKTAIDPAQLVGQVRDSVQSIDPEQAVADVRTMDQWVSRSLENRRTPMVLIALFGGVALVLSAIGIYGVLAFGVAQRVREFGIRQALGADRRAILSLVFSQGLRTAGAGVLLGLGGALAVSRFLQALLFGVGRYDASVFGSVTILLLTVAAAACFVPALRATRIEPVVALRES
jgi:predicted permease